MKGGILALILGTPGKRSVSPLFLFEAIPKPSSWAPAPLPNICANVGAHVEWGNAVPWAKDPVLAQCPRIPHTHWSCQGTVRTTRTPKKERGQTEFYGISGSLRHRDPKAA